MEYLNNKVPNYCKGKEIKDAKIFHKLSHSPIPKTNQTVENRIWWKLNF